VARYATAEEWAEVAALRDEVGALRVSCAVADSAVERLAAALVAAEAVADAADAYVLWEAQVHEPGRVVEDWHEYTARETALYRAVLARRAATREGR
jgi:hypothetical protein